MKRSEKKGFTIVELVIVIAVIAILAAVLIPNLSKLVTNANETADTMLIKELNTALDLDLDRHETMYDALVAVERAGFIVSRINASVAGNEILWDSVNDCFVYLKGNEIVYQANREETPVDRSKKHLYWRIYESLPTEQTYSIYLNNETYSAATPVTVGFDAGRNKNEFAVNYTGTGTAQKVILRTDGQNLTVNAGKDTVNHYGATRTLTVTAVATSDCYHEHGFVGTLASFESGKLVAYRGAQYHQTKNDIVAKLDGKTFDLDKAIFGQHYYDAQGICIVSGCGKTSNSHVHNFVDGTCACGAKENAENPQTCAPKIKIVLDENGKSKGLALDEASVGEVEWSRYEIILRIPFYVAEYTTEDKSADPDYEFIEQDYFLGYFKKSTLSAQYKLDFTYSINKNSNNANVPYDRTTAFAFWNLQAYGITLSGTQSYYVTMPDGTNKLVQNVKYANWGESEVGYYTTQFTAIGGIDIINGLFGDTASETICLIQNELEVPTYIVKVYDDNNNMIGEKEYPSVLACTSEYLDSYIGEFEQWLSDNSKDDTRESLIEYHNNGHQFSNAWVEVRSITNTMGVGATGSDIMRSIVTGAIQATTSTFDLYKIIITADGQEYSSLLN